MNKSVDDSLKYFAKRIFDWGNTNLIGGVCLVPSCYKSIVDTDEYCHHSDVLYEKFHATHIDLHFTNRNKFVRLRLYYAEAFGACIVNESHKISEFSFAIEDLF